MGAGGAVCPVWVVSRVSRLVGVGGGGGGGGVGGVYCVGRASHCFRLPVVIHSESHTHVHTVLLYFLSL